MARDVVDRSPFVPRTAIALIFFEPITAPTPQRPAWRPKSCVMQEKTTPFSPGGSDRRDLEVLAEVVLHPLLEVERAHAPVVARRPELDRVVVDVEIDGSGEMSLEDDHVIAGVLDLGAEHARPCSNRRGRSWRGRCIRTRSSIRTGRTSPSVTPGRHDELVVGTQGVRVSGDLFVEYLRHEPARAQPVPGEVGLGRHLPDVPRLEVMRSVVPPNPSMVLPLGCRSGCPVPRASSYCAPPPQPRPVLQTSVHFMQRSHLMGVGASACV